MIRVIKPGMQEFYAFCTHCGCEFTYELSDINLCAFIFLPFVIWVHDKTYFFTVQQSI